MATKTTKNPLDNLSKVKTLTPIKDSKVAGTEKIAARSKTKPVPEAIKPDYANMNASLRNAAIHEKSVEVIKQLRTIGLQAVAYDRAPVGPLVFTMGLDANGEVYRFWTGNADVTVIDSITEPKPQAVVHVKEDAHTVKMNVQRLMSYTTAPITGSRLSSIAFPDKTVITVKDGEWLDPKPGTRQSFNRRVFKAQLIAKVPKFDNYYLIGYDENKCFISQLPKPVKNVKEAIASLKPAGLVNGYVRQGEWFFNPCSKAEIVTIEKHIKTIRRSKNQRRRWMGDDCTYEWANGACKRKADYTRDVAPYARLENGSSHSAQFYVEYGNTKYVKGEIYDQRTGRHAPLQLENWHRVIRNNEVAQTQTSQGVRPARRWD